MPLFEPKAFDLTSTRTFDANDRHNLVRIDTLQNPILARARLDSPELRAVAGHIRAARENDRPVVLFYGAHVIKCGLSRYLIDWVKRGIVTHLASNGAGSIHDFELAYLGGTSESVPTAIEDGSFGMWEQTGAWMNAAIIAGNRRELGYGHSLAEYVEKYPKRFPYKNDCVFFQAYTHGVAATYHISIGTDIIHQHPTADFAALGGASGQDFRIFVNSIKHLEGGVFLNIGSAVMGAEVFLKALSIVRNNGFKTQNITTANFDIVDLGDYKAPVSDTNPDYYYRPRKNIVNRPVSLGGNGYHICGNHLDTIPTLHALLME